MLHLGPLTRQWNSVQGAKGFIYPHKDIICRKNIVLPAEIQPWPLIDGLKAFKVPWPGTNGIIIWTDSKNYKE